MIQQMTIEELQQASQIAWNEWNELAAMTNAARNTGDVDREITMGAKMMKAERRMEEISIEIASR